MQWQHFLRERDLLIKRWHRIRHLTLNIDSTSKSVSHVIAHSQVSGVQNIGLMTTSHGLTNHGECRTLSRRHLGPVGHNKSNPHGTLRGRDQKRRYEYNRFVVSASEISRDVTPFAS